MTTKSATLSHKSIAHIRQSTRIPLVLHDSSRVPDPELAATEMVKVNLGTTLNITFTGAVRAAMKKEITQLLGAVLIQQL